VKVNQFCFRGLILIQRSALISHARVFLIVTFLADQNAVARWIDNSAVYGVVTPVDVTRGRGTRFPVVPRTGELARPAIDCAGITWRPAFGGMADIIAVSLFPGLAGSAQHTRKPM